MKKNIIAVGTQIDMADGYAIVKHINVAGLCYCQHFIYSEKDPNEMEDAGEIRLTANDIARYLKEVDGENHTIRIER